MNYGDGHNEVLETFYPISTTYLDIGGMAVSDNIFFEEEDQALDNDYMPGGMATCQGADVILTHVIATDDNGKGGSSDAFIHD